MWYIHPKLREICIEVESYKSVFKMSTQIVYIHCVYAQFLISTKYRKKDMHSIAATKASISVMGD